ncbi:hypothetical protein QFZ75_007995 [Streptomyces sp. V3I8]|uniref:hypothetical protein n=1 Tax=Streptomyces sp. V3I8 TaxID=3042279 RepID=UPI002785918D|nr:hypothetical protein [Streptomyces sp. V3I8]MDQ1041493.1 hypothetical protein [Streptomyces sp. V3I8]
MSETAERTRINVIDPGSGSLQGWFVLEAATRYLEQAAYINGFDKRSVNTLSTDAHQTLYRTKRGRWVLSCWTDWQNDIPTYEFVDEDTAKRWLILNDEDAAVEEHFGPMDEESGPNLGGRPAIGPKIPGFPVPQALLERVDDYAKGEGISRNEAMRRLMERGLESPPVA